MHVYTRFAILFLITTTVVMTVMGDEVSPSDDALEHLTSSLHSDVMKELARNAYGDLSNRESVKAKAAVDVFADLAAQEVLFQALDNRNFKVKAYVASLLRGVVKKGDAKALQSLLSRLEGTLTLISGGTEIDLLRSEYRKNLLQVISVVTEQEFSDSDPASESDIRKAIKVAKKWLDAKETVRR